MTIGCSDRDRSLERQAVAVTGIVSETAPKRQCYRNEYLFNDDPDQKDVESLTVQFKGDHVVGEYNWLPAFKDKRVGRFEGAFDGQSISASYEFTQEGQLGAAKISIRVGPDQVIVEGESPQLGLNATIARVDC